jgi:hypothetical protein
MMALLTAYVHYVLQAAAATVLRDGHLQQVPAAELVPGDIVELTGEVLQILLYNRGHTCNTQDLQWPWCVDG